MWKLFPAELRDVPEMDCEAFGEEAFCGQVDFYVGHIFFLCITRVKNTAFSSSWQPPQFLK